MVASSWTGSSGPSPSISWMGFLLLSPRLCEGSSQKRVVAGSPLLAAGQPSAHQARRAGCVGQARNHLAFIRQRGGRFLCRMGPS